jgi:hypothetical protein
MDPAALKACPHGSTQPFGIAIAWDEDETESSVEAEYDIAVYSAPGRVPAILQRST